MHPERSGKTRNSIAKHTQLLYETENEKRKIKIAHPCSTLTNDKEYNS